MTAPAYPSAVHDLRCAAWLPPGSCTCRTADGHTVVPLGAGCVACGEEALWTVESQDSCSRCLGSVMEELYARSVGLSGPLVPVLRGAE